MEDKTKSPPSGEEPKVPPASSRLDMTLDACIKVSKKAIQKNRAEKAKKAGGKKGKKDKQGAASSGAQNGRSDDRPSGQVTNTHAASQGVHGGGKGGRNRRGKGPRDDEGRGTDSRASNGDATGSPVRTNGSGSPRGNHSNGNGVTNSGRKGKGNGGGNRGSDRFGEGGPRSGVRGPEKTIGKKGNRQRKRSSFGGGDSNNHYPDRTDDDEAHDGYRHGDQDRRRAHDPPQSIADRMQPRGRQNQNNSKGGCRIIVSNLNGGVSEEDIRELFGAVGPLVSTTLYRNDDGDSLCRANVIFEKMPDALESIKRYNNVPLDNMPLRISLATEKSSEPGSSPRPQNHRDHRDDSREPARDSPQGNQWDQGSNDYRPRDQRPQQGYRRPQYQRRGRGRGAYSNGGGRSYGGYEDRGEYHR